MYRLVINERKTALGPGTKMSFLIKATTKREAVAEALGQLLGLDRMWFAKIDCAFVGVHDDYSGDIADPAHYSNVVFLVKGGKHRSMSKLFWEVR